MPTSILPSPLSAKRVVVLTQVDIGVFSFLIGTFVVAVIFRGIPVLVISACTFIIFFGTIYMLITRKEEKVQEQDRMKLPRQPEEEKDSSIQIPGLPTRFSYEELCVPTSNFEEKLGGGGFGSVFKGRLQDGTSIAVKLLENLSLDMKGFLAEVETIGSIHHFNLVKLIGYCKDKSHRLLVYGYVPNGSLDTWIFSRDPEKNLNWQIRKRIAIDIAKGLAYLHEECSKKIIHLDVKPQNILLDENFNAKVSDFGLSKLMDRDKSKLSQP